MYKRQPRRMPVFDELVEHLGRFRALRAPEQVFLASVADRKQKKRRECLGMRILGGGEELLRACSV